MIDIDILVIHFDNRPKENIIRNVSWFRNCRLVGWLLLFVFFKHFGDLCVCVWNNKENVD